MRQILIALLGLFTLLLIQGCNNGYTLNTTDVDTANMKKYPAGMVINGYTLPPEPNKTMNNKTLLGVDSNGDGIRDDVERFIIISNSKLGKDKYPKTWTAIQLQFSKAEFGFIREQNKKNALEWSRALECQGYFLKHGIKKHGYTGLKARKNFVNKYSSMNVKESFYMTYRSDKAASWYGNERHKLISGGGRVVRTPYCDKDLTKLGEW